MAEIQEIKCECGEPAVGSMIISARARHATFKPMCDECAKKDLGTCKCGKPATGKTFGTFDGMGVPTRICDECNVRVQMGEKTVRQVLEDLEKQLNVEGLLDEGLSPSSWGDSAEFFDQKAKDLRFRWIACFAVTGNSEGWYIHIDLVLDGFDENQQCKTQHLALGKTFRGRIHAFAIAARAAELLGA